MKPLEVILVRAEEGPALIEMRRTLRSAMQSCGWMAVWQEYRPDDTRLPASVRNKPGIFVLVGSKVMSGSNADELAAVLQEAARKRSRWEWLRKPLTSGAVLPGILLAFFPKCAGCWAAYASVFGSAGLGIPYMPWLKHVIAATMVVSAVYFFRMAKRRQRWIPFGFQMAGFACALFAQYVLVSRGIMWTGVALVGAGSLLYAIPQPWFNKLNHIIRPLPFSKN